ncbi:MAG: hypothetical protein V2I39_03970 [Erythrobacter sp.]|jgi:hypothetical protein|nr:hypothetical protein [Erythrobacter sp.]
MRTIRIALGLALAGMACPPAHADPASPASRAAEQQRLHRVSDSLEAIAQPCGALAPSDMAAAASVMARKVGNVA